MEGIGRVLFGLDSGDSNLICVGVKGIGGVEEAGGVTGAAGVVLCCAS